jgi:hypothetical protein
MDAQSNGRYPTGCGKAVGDPNWMNWVAMNLVTDFGKVSQNPEVFSEVSIVGQLDA